MTVQPTERTPEQALADVRVAKEAYDLERARWKQAADAVSRARSTELYHARCVADARDALREAERRLKEAVHAE